MSSALHILSKVPLAGKEALFSMLLIELVDMSHISANSFWLRPRCFRSSLIALPRFIFFFHSVLVFLYENVHLHNLEYCVQDFN